MSREWGEGGLQNILLDVQGILQGSTVFKKTGGARWFIILLFFKFK